MIARSQTGRTLAGTVLALAAVLDTVLHVFGCGVSSSAISSDRFIEPAAIAAADDRFDAVVGRTLVIPVRLTLETTTARIADRVRLLEDDGSVIPGRLFQLEVRPDDGPPGWLPGPGRWSATPASQVSPSTQRTALRSWVVVAEVGPNSRPRRLRLGISPFMVQWVEDDPASTATSRPIVPSARTDSIAAAHLLGPEFASPARRWRGWLATRGSRPEQRDAQYAFADPVLEAIAKQTEGRWGFALARLAREDRSLSDRMVTTLAGGADFGGGVFAPVWPTSIADTDGLLNDLLDPSLDVATRKDRARAWLSLQPASVLWVTDDAGHGGIDDLPLSGSAAVVSLLERREIARVDIGKTPRSGQELLVLEPGVVRRINVVADHGSEELAPAPTDVKVRGTVIQSSQSLTLTKIPARPPRFLASPFLWDYTLESWLAGTADSPSHADSGTAAILYRSVSGRWTLHVEMSIGPSGEVSPVDIPDAARLDDKFIVWLGPVGSEYRIEIVRGQSPLGAGADGRSFVPEVNVAEGLSRWTAQIILPDGAVEKNGTLRLAIEKRDRAGRRSFPRPMLPWQTVPGRIAIDTTAW